MSDENEESNPPSKFGDKFKNSTRRVRTKAQEAGQRAAEQASKAAEQAGKVAENARDLGNKAAENAGKAAENARDLGNKAAENARDLHGKATDNAADLKDRAAEAVNDKVENILEALNKAGSSVSDAGKDAGVVLSEEAELALEVIRARFPELVENLDDQVQIVSRMPAQTHRQLVFAYAMFAARWIPMFGARFATGQLVKRLSKYVDENRGDIPRKQKGVPTSTYRWIKDYQQAKVVWEQQKRTDGPDGGGHQL